MRTVCDYTDFFVIATGGNTRQTKAISDEVHFVLKRDHGLLPRAVAGEREGTWIIADYTDSVLHVFTDGDAGVLPARGSLERRAEARGRRKRLIGVAL